LISKRSTPKGKISVEAFAAVAEEINADMLVIASQDRRPLVARGLVDLDKLLGGSVSDYIRVHAPAPVLLVREPERG
jgi:nucleotide-binding universal stress UspA family protein